MVDPNIVETYTVGKEGFIVALCEALGVPALIDQSLTSPTGRPPEIPYGVLAMMMMVTCVTIIVLFTNSKNTTSIRTLKACSTVLSHWSKSTMIVLVAFSIFFTKLAVEKSSLKLRQKPSLFMAFR